MLNLVLWLLKQFEVCVSGSDRLEQVSSFQPEVCKIT
jgi:hypothetical protein